MRSEIALLLLCGLTLLSGGCDRRSGENGQGNAVWTSGEVSSGEAKGGGAGKSAFTATVDRKHKGEDAPDVVFKDPAGKDVTLADYRGKPLLVNLWATWCGPCVAEMPLLDRIADAHKDLRVLTVSQDSGDAAAVAAFFPKHGLAHLTAWRDPENGLGFHYATGLLPTTVLYDREGREVARVAGALDWDGEAGRALIEELAQ